MKLKGQKSRTLFSISFLALDISLFFCLGVPATASGKLGSRVVSFSHTPESLENHDAALSSVSISDSLVFPIVPQPQGDSNYVSKKNGEVTQFFAASQYGNIGLLAHNYLSGKSFSKLAIGQEIHLLYDDDTIEYFIVTEILRYQALQPRSPFSAFRNLNNREEVLSAQQMFERAYAGGRHLTFQTCIAAQGNSSWGRLFVVATPKAVIASVASQNLQH